MSRKKITSLFKDSISVKEATLRKEIAHIEKAAAVMTEALKRDGKILLFGNGGSAADAQHIAAELVGRFQKERRALPAISLVSNVSNLTCIANDYGYDRVFKRQIEALGKRGDVAVGISTSGKSASVNLAIRRAKGMGLKTIALTGGTGGELVRLADLAIVVPSSVTARIQETHITIGHILCELAEEALS